MVGFFQQFSKPEIPLGKCLCAYIITHSRGERSAGVFVFLLLFNILTFMLWLILKSYSEFQSSLPMGQKACRLLPVSTAGLVATSPSQQIYKLQGCQLKCIWPMQHSPHLAPYPIGPKGHGTCREQDSVLNAMVPIASSEAWHLRTHGILPSWKNGDKRRSSHTTFLLGPLDKANVAAELWMIGEEGSEGRAKEEE